MLDEEINQEVGEMRKEMTEGLQEKGRREVVVRAMRWDRVFLPPDIDVRHLLSCHESIVL